METDNEYERLVKLVWWWTPAIIGCICCVVFAYMILTGTHGVSVPDPTVIGKMFHYQTLLYLFIAFTVVLVSKEHTGNGYAFYWAVAAGMNGHALADTLTHVFGWWFAV